MTNSSGTIVWQQSFDPFGNPTAIVSTTPPDFGYAGMYVHQRSGLDLTMFRAYSSSLGRWLSRDPLGESGGLNLYGYVGNNPISGIDSLGLCDPSNPSNSNGNPGFFQQGGIGLTAGVSGIAGVTAGTASMSNGLFWGNGQGPSAVPFTTYGAIAGGAGNPQSVSIPSSNPSAYGALGESGGVGIGVFYSTASQTQLPGTFNTVLVDIPLPIPFLGIEYQGAFSPENEGAQVHSVSLTVGIGGGAAVLPTWTDVNVP
jgi:RHS repeat-associated protein